MAITEKNGLLTAVDASGNTYLIYPITNVDAVDGLDEALAGKLGTDLKGSAEGLAELDSTGKVPSAQLPSYLPWNYNQIDLSDTTIYDENTWYPVVGTTIPSSGMHRLLLYTYLGASMVPSWCTHTNGFSCDLDLLVKHSGWGETDAQSLCLTYNCKFTNNVNPCSFSQLGHSSKPVFWLRGGGKYHILSDYQCTWTAYTSTYTYNNESVSPFGSCPVLSIVKSTITADLDGIASNASKLATPRTIALTGSVTGSGTFDGSGDLSIETETSNVYSATVQNTATITPTAEGSIIVDHIYGNSYQKQISGKNLYNANSISSDSWSKIDSDGWITAVCNNTDETNVKYMNWFTNTNSNISTSTSYAIVVEIAEIENITGLFIDSPTSSQFGNSFAANKTVGTQVFVKTTIDDFTDAVFCLRTFASVAAGVQGKVKYRISILADTSVTADTFVYEPYCGGIPSPNPDYPQEIESVGDSGSVTIKAVGKNLYPHENTVQYLYSPHYTTYTESVGMYLPKGTYSIHHETDGKLPDSGVSGTDLYIRFFDKNTKSPINDSTPISVGSGTWAQYNYRISNGRNFRFTTTDDYYINVTGMSTIASYVQIEVVEEATGVATDYEPYIESTITIPLASGPLRSIGDVKDEIVCQDGVYGVLRRIGSKIYDSSNFVNASDSAYTNIVYFELNKPTDYRYYNMYGHEFDIKCERFKAGYAYPFDDSNAIYTCQNSASKTGVWFGFPYGTTLEEAQSIGTFEYDYILATPTFEPIIYSQIPFYSLKSWNGVTNISFVGESENLTPSATMRFPRNEDGALATTTLCEEGKTSGKSVSLSNSPHYVLMLNPETGLPYFSASLEYNPVTAAMSGFQSMASSSTVGVSSNGYALGTSCKATGNHSFACGNNTTASGACSFACGSFAAASGNFSHAEGNWTCASGQYSHAEGNSTGATGMYSHSEGMSTKASGAQSHAEGFGTTASGNFSHAEGYKTTSDNHCSHASGHYNVAMETGGDGNNTNGTAFVIGNGTASDALSNAFSVMFDGTVKAANTITASTTADYAEFFEWEDGNPDKEDRVGKFVTINGDKISIATSNEDYILGIVSGAPFVLGNGDCDTWNGMYLKDEFNRTIYEPAPKLEFDEESGEMKEVLDEDGNVVYEGTRPVLNPDYDPNKTYISRFNRPEWAPVGMLGVLAVIDDGTCEINGYACCNSEGIATACNRTYPGAYRVIQRVTDNVVKVILK